MTQSDLNLLLDMGFEKARAELAVKKTGGLQGALQWLEDNQDKPLEDLQKAAASGPADDEDDDAATAAQIAALETGQLAKSLVCNECGKKFRSQEAAEFHATKSQHTDFSESTEEIAPLTEEEKKAKLEELREKARAKKAAQSAADAEEAKKNEKIRAKATQQTQDLKEEVARKEQIKEAQRKRAEKAEDLEAKKRIKAKIEADKEERRRKAEEAKAIREGHAPAVAPAEPTAAPAAAAPAASTRNDARLRLQLPDGKTMQITREADATLGEIALAVESEQGFEVTKFELTFPRKHFERGVDFGKTLREAGCVPSAVLRVHKQG